jgi:serine/threonine-protein kinase
MVGQLVGKYRVVSRLGRGGMGTVYKALDETLNREVAIKCLNPDVGDAEVLKRFRAEAIALARLNHPNIATLFELTEHNGELLMVMEFVRGETFDQVSANVGPMPVERASQLAGQVFDALAHAHRAGVVHRDLKPANLMLTESGLVKVMDFGLARMAGTEHLTNDGYMVGTPAYMSPEQVLGWEIDGRADLYAMGVVLFRLLTGQLPFKAASGIAMAHKQINDPPTPVRQLRTELSWELEEVLKKALSKPPGDRYQTADEFKAAMASVVGAPSGPSAEATPTLSLSRSDALFNSRTMPSAAASATTATEAPTTGIPVVQPPASSGSTARRIPLAASVAVGAVVLVGVPAVLMWRARAVQPEIASAAPAIQTPAPAAAVPPEAPPPLTPPAKTPDAVKASDGATPRPPLATGNPAKSGAGRSDADKLAAAKDPAASAGKEPAPSGAAVLPVVTFGKLKLLTLEEGKSRDRDASLSLGPDALQVLDGNTTLKSAPYRDILSVFHSHSREPRWTGPDGKSAAVGKAGGKFSFLKGAPDWITVRTKQMFIPLSVPDGDLPRIIKELESRTGTKVVRVR